MSRWHEVGHSLFPVIASAAKQSMSPWKERMDCFVATLLTEQRGRKTYETTMRLPLIEGLNPEWKDLYESLA